MTAIAQSMFNGLPVMLSTARLTPTEMARWVAHQYVQLEKSLRTIMLKIETSHILIENLSKNWRQDSSEVYALEPKDRFMESKLYYVYVALFNWGQLHSLSIGKIISPSILIPCEWPIRPSKILKLRIM